LDVIRRPKIDDLVAGMDPMKLLKDMQQGFINYSQGRSVIPPVGELILPERNGEVHIKYGYTKEEAYYCIKIASGFYDNPALNLDSSQGMMLLFSQETGAPKAIILDEGYLTNLRTAIAGALVAKAMSPNNVTGVGIVGTGVQARFQLEELVKSGFPVQKVWIWGRNPVKAQALQTHFSRQFEVNIASSTTELAQHCNLIITTTTAKNPLLMAADIQPGTHISAIGSDTPDKQELASDILGKANLVVADSLSQCAVRGEIFHATAAGELAPNAAVELGNVLAGDHPGRVDDGQITVADLTGVAVQDIAIADAVYQAFLAE
jgi:ornithine cyclodeaminase